MFFLGVMIKENLKTQPPSEAFGLHEIKEDSGLKSNMIENGSGFGGGRRAPSSFDN